MSKELEKNLREVFQSVMPITLVVIVLQVALVSMPAVVFARFLMGALLVAAGLLLFMQGVRTALLPMGERIGAELPRRGSLKTLLPVAFLLGFIVTIAEPNVKVLTHQVDVVADGSVDSTILLLAVSLGIGVFMVMAVLRIVLGIPIAWLFAAGYVAILILSLFTAPDLVPVALDAGGMATGPVSIPFILSFGVGTASVLGGRSSITDGFGLVGLASIGPILGVMILGVFYR